MIKAPCYNETTKTDCPKRAVGCHERCEAWRKYEKLRDEEYRQRQIEREAKGAIYEHRNKVIANKYRRSIRWYRNNRKRHGDN